MENQSVNLAVVLDIKLDSGGTFHMSESQIFFLRKLKKKNKNINISLVATNKDLFFFLKKKYNFNIYYYKKNFFVIRLLNFFYKKISKFFTLNSHFEFFLKKRNINLVYFCSPSYLVLLFKNLEFIYTVFDLIDKKLEKLSEHNQSTVNLRHKCYKHATLYAKKIFITNNQRKKIFIKNYNCFSKKIFTIQFPPSVCLNRLESKKVKINFADKTIDSYIFYPAQYWSHKNHSYVIKSMIKFRSNKLKKLGCIFTGHDKGQLSYLKEYAKKIGIDKKIIFYNYLSNNQLVYLYKHCFCVLFPSLIGFDSFPLYEAFYFKKMIIYNKNIIDKLFIKNIIPLNVSKNYDLEKKILFLKKNNRIFKKILIKNNKLYKKNFSQVQIQFNNLIVN